MIASRGEGASVAEWLATAVCILVYLVIAPWIEKRGFKRTAAVARILGIVGACLFFVSMNLK